MYYTLRMDGGLLFIKNKILFYSIIILFPGIKGHPDLHELISDILSTLLIRYIIPYPKLTLNRTYLRFGKPTEALHNSPVPGSTYYCYN